MSNLDIVVDDRKERVNKPVAPKMARFVLVQHEAP